MFLFTMVENARDVARDADGRTQHAGEAVASYVAKRVHVYFLLLRM